MTQKTLDLRPTNWYQNDEPYAGLNWSPTIGNADMLAYNDGDYAVCDASAQSVAIDSEGLRATGYQLLGGGYPVFESDWRNLNVTCQVVGRCGQSGKYVNFAAVMSWPGGYDDRWLNFGDGGMQGKEWTKYSSSDNAAIVAALQQGTFFTGGVYPFRPADGDGNKIEINAIYITVTYEYGPLTKPAQFAFGDKSGAVNTQVVSNTITLSGVTPGYPIPVSITGTTGEYSINGGPYTAAQGTAYNGDTITLRGTFPPTVGAFYDITFLAETTSDVWRITGGSDVPTTVTPPADLIASIPGGFMYPNKSVVDALAWSGYWSFSGNAVPMPFRFNTDRLEYAIYNGNTLVQSWVPGTTVGTLPLAHTIRTRFRTPDGFGTVLQMTLTYGSTNQTRTVTSTNAYEGYTHAVDLSPIDAGQQAVPGQGVTAWYTPTPSGSMNHFTVSTTVTATSTGSGYQAQVWGKWWRQKVDGALFPWPTGVKVTSVAFGVNANTSTGGSSGSILYQHWCNPPGGNISTLTGQHDMLNNGNLSNRNLTWFPGGTSPTAIVPTGYTQQTLHDAVINDTIVAGSNGYITPGAQLSTSIGYRVMRVYFQITRPPEGMLWEG